MSDKAPIPNNADTRQPDIIREQVEKTASKDPVTAAQADLPREGVGTPPPSTPPPFPDLPIQFTPQPPPASGSDLYEAAKAAVTDVFKNVTINGSSPSSSGMGFDFSIKSPESAGDAFVRLNAAKGQEFSTTLPVATPPESPRQTYGPTIAGGFDTTPKGGSHIPKSMSADGSVLDQSAETSREAGTHKMAGGANRRGSDDGIPSGEDMMSKKRLHGESHKEFDERQAQIKSLEKDPATVGAITSGDTSYFYKGMVPILLTRADDKRDIIAYIEPINTHVVRGAAGGERSGAIPSSDSYYTSEKKSLRRPWEIVLVNLGPDRGGWKMGVSGDSDVYDGVSFDNKTVTGLLVDQSNPSSAGWSAPQMGFLYLKGTVNNGDVSTITLEKGVASLSGLKRVTSASNEQTEFIHVLGYVWSEGAGQNVNWMVRQEAWRHLTLLSVVVNGVLCKVPFEM